MKGREWKVSLKDIFGALAHCSPELGLTACQSSPNCSTWVCPQIWPLLLLPELEKVLLFSLKRMLRDKILDNMKCWPYKYVAHNVFNLCSSKFPSQGLHPEVENYSK